MYRLLVMLIFFGCKPDSSLSPEGLEVIPVEYLSDMQLKTLQNCFL